jgi:hypothetical protein
MCESARRSARLALETLGLLFRAKRHRDIRIGSD